MQRRFDFTLVFHPVRLRFLAVLLAALLMLGGCAVTPEPRAPIPSPVAPGPLAEAPAMVFSPRVGQGPAPSAVQFAAPNIAPSSTPPQPVAVQPAAPKPTTQVLVGKASYYAHKFHGRKTANGETFNMYAMTAAHRTLPFGTVVRVTNRANGRQVLVRINDRGPFIDGRIIDLSLGAAQRLDMIEAGVVPVKIEVLTTVTSAEPGH